MRGVDGAAWPGIGVRPARCPPRPWRSSARTRDWRPADPPPWIGMAARAARRGARPSVSSGSARLPAHRRARTRRGGPATSPRRRREHREQQRGDGPPAPRPSETAITAGARRRSAGLVRGCFLALTLEASTRSPHALRRAGLELTAKGNAPWRCDPRRGTSRQRGPRAGPGSRCPSGRAGSARCPAP